MLRHVTIFTLTLTAISAAHADDLTPAGSAQADVRLCYASGSTGPQVPCVRQDQTWRQLLRPTDPADRMTIAPSITASAGSLANALFPTYVPGLSTAYMPPPSGDAATDAANFAVAQATGARTIVFQAGTKEIPAYLVPPAGYAELRSNQNIVGQGTKETILRLDEPGTYESGILYGNEKSNIGIYKLTIDQGNFREPNKNSSVLNFRNGENIIVRNVNLINFPRYGFNVNAGSNISYIGGRIVRSTDSRDASGELILKGQQNQCVLISENINNKLAPINQVLFQDIYCKGSAFNVSGADVDYVRIVVDGFDFGFAYVTEQGANSKRHRFRDVVAMNGRTNPDARVTIKGKSVDAGKDDNNTSAGCLEVWSPESSIDNAVCDDVGGDGVALGGQNLRITNSRFTRLGMQVQSNGIVARYEPSKGYTATGSFVANNTVVNSNGSGDGSNLLFPYYQQEIAPDLVVSLAGNNFGSTPLRRKAPNENWSAPGMLVAETTLNGYTHPSGTRQSPAAAVVEGARRAKDTIMGATFVGTDGSALPAGCGCRRLLMRIIVSVGTLRIFPVGLRVLLSQPGHTRPD